MSVSVCLSERVRPLHISKTTRPNFTEFQRALTVAMVLVLSRRLCDVLCTGSTSGTSGFVDNVKLSVSRNGPYSAL